MIKIKYFIVALMAAITLNSCSDMFDDGSNRYITNPSLDDKVDSMFYINGILKGVQQAIDQNVLINELRGDLLTTTKDASTDLQKLASFDYSGTNKYDSAYVYYRIINNCNYYIAHRDTTLITGSSEVAMKEYAEAKAIRAWAYLQLTHNYGKVPFYTKPLTDIAGIENAASSEKKDINGITAELAPDLEQYVDLPVPNWDNFDAGTNDAGNNKTVNTAKMMIPVRLILADLYLESGNYAKAVEHYFKYLKKNKETVKNYFARPTYSPDYNSYPNSLKLGYYNTVSTTSDWKGCYMNDLETDTYVAMATNKLRGEITALPGLFGYNYYTSSDGTEVNEKISLEPTKAYLNLSNSQDYYYANGNGNGSSEFNMKNLVYAKASIGDMRYHSSYERVKFSTQVELTKVILKYYNANITLYKTSGIYLKLAEAVNRMGHPDVAFAVLKDGWNHTLEEDTTYMTQEGIQFLKTTLPFLTPENRVVFNDESETNGVSMGNQGIHARGAGFTMGNGSGYQFQNEINKKLAQLGHAYPANATAEDSLRINQDCVEDLLCDEMALELAWEGSRYGDLCRIARHKNTDSYWGTNYGSLWLRDKLAFKNLSIDLSNPENWFMPFK